MSIDAMKLALEALEEIALAGMSGTGQESDEAMTEWHARQAWKFIGIAARQLDSLRQAIREAEEQAPWDAYDKAMQAQPVAWMWKDGTITADPDRADGTWTPLYTTSTQRKPLTSEELYKVFPAIASYTEANKTLYSSIARAIEAAHGIKENI